MTNKFRAARLKALLLASPVLAALPGCTDLTEVPISAITPENYYRNEVEVIGGLASVYAQLRGPIWGWYNASEISSDELIVPTRGPDWYDNGRWLELHRHTWGPSSPAGLDDLNGPWVDAWTGVARANVLLGALENVTVPNKEVVQAEVRALRAFYYYILMDLYGGVPIVETTEIQPRARATRQETFDFIERELLAAREALPASWPAAAHGRMTKGAASAILASMYLNAGVFTKDNSAESPISTTSYNSCATVTINGQSACQRAVDAANAVLNSGQYSLATDWRSNFTPDNHTSPENIFVVKYIAQEGLGFEMMYRGLHYHQLSPDPWNGFAVEADTYRAFDAADQRRNIFLVGPQNHVLTGQPVNNRQGQRLEFTVEIPDATQASEGHGTRLYKWTADPNKAGSHHANDYAYFRLAEMHLIRAEAMVEQSEANIPAAVGILNMLRARVFEPDKPITGVTTRAQFRQAVLNERLFELTGEAKRRQDLIRAGLFDEPWGPMCAGVICKAQSPQRVLLMSIPQNQMDANPLLTQNPGY